MYSIVNSRKQLRYDAPPVRVRPAAPQARAGADVPEFRGAALQAQTITAQEWLLAGPSETGKTWAALWRLDALLCATKGAQAALIRKVAADIGPTVLRTYKKVIELTKGSSLFPFNSFNNNGYRQVCNTGASMIGGARRNRRQYRLIHEFYSGAIVDAKED